MKIRILGAHHAESKQTRLVSFLIDDRIAVDAGCIASELTLEEQQQIQAILLTHEHYDHIKGVPSFIFNNLRRETKIYATSQTLKILSTHLFDGVIYPNFTGKTSFLEKPPIKPIPIEPEKTITIEGYSVRAFPITHATGSVAYEITSQKGVSVFFSGDTGPGLADIWKTVAPNLLIIEVTFPNKMEKTAKDASHLCPKLLQQELESFHDIQKYYPQVLVIHLNPKYEHQIRQELETIANKLKIPIEIATEGMAITL